ncbi:hypothetical protein VPH35_110584 [Triticum aestivum]
MDKLAAYMTGKLVGTVIKYGVQVGRLERAKGQQRVRQAALCIVLSKKSRLHHGVSTLNLHQLHTPCSQTSLGTRLCWHGRGSTRPCSTPSALSPSRAHRLAPGPEGERGDARR